MEDADGFAECVVGINNSVEVVQRLLAEMERAEAAESRAEIAEKALELLYEEIEPEADMSHFVQAWLKSAEQALKEEIK